MQSSGEIPVLRLFGVPKVDLGRQAIGRLPDKAFMLFALLATEFGGVALREHAQSALWEGSLETDRIATNFRWLMTAVRRWQQANDMIVLDISRTHVALAEGIESDAGLLTSWSVAAPPDAERLLATYPAPLLSGLGAELGSLLLVQRSRLQDKFVALALAAAPNAADDRAEELLRRAESEAPDDERVIRALIELLRDSKGRAAAQGTYRAWRGWLASEVGAEPEPETVALADNWAPQPVAERREPRGKGIDVGIPRLALLPPVAPLGAPPRTLALGMAVVDDVVRLLYRERSFALFAPHTVHQLLLPGRELAVDARFVGRTSLLPMGGGRYRMTITLSDNSNQQVLLSDDFPFEDAELEQRAADVAALIGHHIARAVAQAELSRFEVSGAASAYVHTLLGVRDLMPFDLRALRRARGHFGRALHLEPDYVPALTGLARTLTREKLALRRSEPDLVHRANLIAVRATELDPANPETWREQAQARLYLHDIGGSLEMIGQAVERARYQSDLLAERADILTHAGRHEEARADIDKALELNPFPPDWYWWAKGTAEYFLHNYAVATQTLCRITAIPGASRLTAAAAAMAGNMEVAHRYRRRWLDLYPDSRVADIPRFMPHGKKQDVEHFMAGVKLAGFP